ncbi:Predicted integral membrane protein [Aedoeadaptatus ivorii]|uniref:Predicted integral membrane protein n=1 Tax=Aedoeadaptatus ivorii TaxID=54006 RepID=A0A448V294_9FIRM|nr:Predicted integral membrane protein [Peptoniphilus ivorii]
MVFLVAMGVLLVPIIMIVFGWLLYARGPKEINPTYGYRTKRSMKSPEAWQFAQKFFGKIWLVTDIVLAVAGLLFCSLRGIKWEMRRKVLCSASLLQRSR